MPRSARVIVSTCDSTTLLCSVSTTFFLMTMVISMFTVAGAPVDDRQRRYSEDTVVKYLTQFGYFPQSDIETDSLRSDDQLRDAIRNLQAFAGLPATGEITEETKRLMALKRCGLPDVTEHHFRNKRYTLHGQKWHHNNLTWSLNTWAGYLPPELQERPLRRELHKALDIWSRHSKLTFQELSSTDKADIVVKFERGDHYDGYAFDGRGQVLAHAFFPGKNRGGDAHFDADELWLLEGQEDEDGTSVLAVAAHEFGHSLGLAHSSVQGALMFPWYSGIPDNFELPQDDRIAIEQLYGRRETRWGVINDTPVHRWNPPPTEQPRRPYRPRPTTTTTTTRRPIPTTTTRPVRRPPVTKRIMHSNPKLADAPITCNTSYDAISVIGREVFVFKDRYLWRLNELGPQVGYPAEIHRLWPQLPKYMRRVDAVYERMDRKIVFFIGNKFYIFKADRLEPGYPRPLTDLGLPAFLDHVDGAMVWGHNNRTYIFAGNLYWRLDPETEQAELDYPRDMSIWKGVGNNIDAVFKWTDGKTYFFKGKYFWKLNDQHLQVEHPKPKSSAEFWMKCPPPREEDEMPPLPPLPPKEPSSSDNPIASISIHLRFNILSFILFIVPFII